MPRSSEGGASKPSSHSSALFSRIAQWFIGLGREATEVSVVTFGLDNAGKTTLLNLLSNDPDKDIVPTVGKNEAIIRWNGNEAKVHLYDLGGGKTIRRIWKKFFGRAHGCVCVVDATDTRRAAEAKRELHGAVGDPMLRDKPLLILLNKQDRPGAMQASEFQARFETAKLPCLGKPMIMECRARLFEGDEEEEEEREKLPPDPRIKEGMAWLIGEVRSHFSALDSRVQSALSEEAMQYEAEERSRQERVAKMKSLRAATAEKYNVMENFVCSECLMKPWKDCAKPKSIATDFRPVCDECHEKLREEYKKRAVPTCELCDQRPAVKKAAVRFKSPKVCNECNDRLEGGESVDQVKAAPR